jgi:hypothetical protein
MWNLNRLFTSKPEWKVEPQNLTSELGLEIMVYHPPPGTSKWNRIEHRLFSFISQNWRGKPLRRLATIVNLIGATTTNTGLKVFCIWTITPIPKMWPPATMK